MLVRHAVVSRGFRLEIGIHVAIAKGEKSKCKGVGGVDACE